MSWLQSFSKNKTTRNLIEKRVAVEVTAVDPRIDFLLVINNDQRENTELPSERLLVDVTKAGNRELPFAEYKGWEVQTPRRPSGLKGFFICLDHLMPPTHIRGSTETLRGPTKTSYEWQHGIFISW